jgi:hypothetical protein
MEVKEAEEGKEGVEEFSQEPMGISLGSRDSLKEDRDFVHIHMPQPFHLKINRFWRFLEMMLAYITVAMTY